MHLDPRYFSKEQRTIRKIKAENDALAREQRAKLLIIVHAHMPRMENMKKRQEIVEAMVEELQGLYKWWVKRRLFGMVMSLLKKANQGYGQVKRWLTRKYWPKQYS